MRYCTLVETANERQVMNLSKKILAKSVKTFQGSFSISHPIALMPIYLPSNWKAYLTYRRMRL